MKILYLSNSIIPSRTANSIHVMKMCQAFSENKHEVTLIAPSKKHLYEKEVESIFDFYGVKKYFVIKKLWHPNIKGGVLIYFISILLYLLFNRKYEIVYGRFLYGCYAALIAGYNVFFEAHSSIYKEKKYAINIFTKVINHKKFKKLILISNQLKKIYLNQGFIKENLIKVAHDGADEVKHFNKNILLLGKKKNLKIGYLGHLYKGKGMEVINSLSNKINDNSIEFHIIGGTDNDLNYWKKIITNKNTFFYGFLPPKNVSSYINAMDICLLPNQKIVYSHGSDTKGVNISEFTSPLKMFEYMSHKKAIIASDLPVLKEVLNEKNSLLVSYKDINEWIGAIEKLKNEEFRKKIGNQAFKDFVKYRWFYRAKNVLE